MSQFKVGDWVRSDYITRQISQITKLRIDSNDCVWGYMLSNGETLPLSKLEYWTPSIGEWCWFWEDNSLDDYPRLGLYGHMSWSLEYWDHCEPFIGTLPTWIK